MGVSKNRGPHRTVFLIFQTTVIELCPDARGVGLTKAFLWGSLELYRDMKFESFLVRAKSLPSVSSASVSSKPFLKAVVL